MSRHAELLEGLLAITSGCRHDMHEPDEQSLEARVVGTVFDNAFGEYISGEFLAQGFQELVVILERGDDGRVYQINLATLIALARKAVV